jgi:tol-pal system protein YbgF
MRTALPCAWLALAGGLGCAGEDKHLDSMRAELDEIASTRDEADRKVMAPDDEGTAVPVAKVAAPAQAGAPPLKPEGPVEGPREVILGVPDEAPDEYADTEDTAPRPSIHVIGSPRPGRGGWRGDDQVEQTAAADDATPTTQPQALDPAAKRAYEAALALVAARQYPQALDALAAFLVKWPDHPYADNAMYWRGEAYFARGEYARAAEQFEGVLARFPGGNKVPDALLKLGLCAQKAGDPARARSYFDRLAQQYPQSDAARRIPSAAPSAAPPGPAPEDHK